MNASTMASMRCLNSGPDRYRYRISIFSFLPTAAALIAEVSSNWDLNAAAKFRAQLVLSDVQMMRLVAENTEANEPFELDLRVLS